MLSQKDSFSYRSTVAEALGLDASDMITIGILSLTALVLGAMTMVLTVDVPGDGPTHAMQAYLWSRHPQIQSYGFWLPGYNYVIGLAMIAFPDPLHIARLCNLVFSTLTISAFYTMVHKIYGSPIALLSTFALVVLPLRIGLSASSMTEPAFVFFAITGLLCIMMSVERERVRIVPLVIAMVCLSIAEMTRYEAWPLVAMVICYLFVRTRGIAVTALAAASLLVFPVRWSVGNYFQTGNFFYAFSMAEHPLEGGSPLSLTSAATFLSAMVLRNLGWLLAIGAVAGAVTELYRAFYCRPDERILTARAAYVVMVAILWAMIMRATMIEGGATYDRYLLLGLTLALPLAVVAYLKVFCSYRYHLALGAIAILVSLSIVCRDIYRTRYYRYTSIYVTERKPTEIIAIVNWLRTSRYRSDAIMSTQMDWLPSYLPLYAPEFTSRQTIVSPWTPDEYLRKFVAQQRPALLITTRDDGEQITRLDHALGRAVQPMMHDPVFRSGSIEVYDIAKSTAHQ